ncbi:MAG: non-canonical purine NTP pyrophosphatase [Thermoplasmata archaeon]|nr:non-canonical purine NTP pyrophosphatase [Thermoplasmata archaeon]
MIDVTFVSTNRGKYREIREVLLPYGVRVHWKRRTLPEPQADDLEEVMNAKLDAVRDIPGYVLVEDSGLFIPALRDFPGVYSAHFLRIWKFTPIFRLLKGRRRSASFRTVAGLQNGPRRWAFRGEVHGKIAPRAAGRGGFGYDPIFIPDGWDKTFAEGTPDEKNAISHRARAVRRVGEQLAGRGSRLESSNSVVRRKGRRA